MSHSIFAMKTCLHASTLISAQTLCPYIPVPRLIHLNFVTALTRATCYLLHVLSRISQEKKEIPAPVLPAIPTYRPHDDAGKRKKL